MARPGPKEEHQIIRRHLFDTGFRGVLGVLLFASFPAFSDLYRLWRRDAGVSHFLFGPGEFEYPPLAAVLWRPLSWLPNPRAAVVANGLLMVGAALAITWLLHRSVAEREPADTELWSKSSALVFLLAINWDAAAVLTVVWAVAMLRRNKNMVGGAILGFGAALKIFPGAAAASLFMVLAGWRKRFWFGVAAGGVVGVAYYLYALAEPENWTLHLDFASQRDDYQTTIWTPVVFLLRKLGLEPTLGQINILAITIAGMALLSVAFWVARSQPTLGEAAAVGMAVFLFFNKTFKPQYALWVLPLFALVSVRRPTVKTLEFGAFVEFFAIYFSFPWAITGLAAFVRTLALLAGSIEILRRSDRRRGRFVRIG